MRYAQIDKDGKVLTVIETDQDPETFPESMTFVAGEGKIGERWNGTAFVVDEAERRARIPRTVTMRQARLALLGAGLLPTVDAAVTAMPGAAGEAARIEWEYSGEVQRDKALVKGLSASLGLTETQLDDLFTAAAAL